MQTETISAKIVGDGGGLQEAAAGGLIPSRLARAGGDTGFWREAHDAFRRTIMVPEYPCVGARSALHSDAYVLSVYGRLGEAQTTAALAQDLYEFTTSDLRETNDYATFVAVFETPPVRDEVEFEDVMWQQLSALNRVDAQQFGWDASVRSDPADPQFSFSFGGEALYVIGLHPTSSRLARRFPWPTMIFNPHEQFERLREDGKWKRMQKTIRERDVQLQGSTNPMLSDFGESSEARQYSGRAVEADWQAPFQAANARPGKCPFGH